MYGVLTRRRQRAGVHQLLRNAVQKSSIRQAHFFGGVNNSSGLPLSERAGSFSRASPDRSSFQLENKK
jgi:hypothetical protein